MVAGTGRLTVRAAVVMSVLRGRGWQEWVVYKLKN
jgi:hypothetical protein